ncbi:MAG: DUF86 domain-containing protein [Candidatus Marinimicrobia bacterium]|nr:DUF86 domain-containing protein [Candidatus Neomarinimicrobiota bacterium]
MKRNSSLYLIDILDSCQFIQEFVDGLDYNQFISDEKTTSAVIRKIEIIGEASKNIPDEIKHQASDIPWKEIAGMRDKLIHAYFGVDYRLVWETVQTFIPELKQRVQRLLEE